jgi:hypothetical protein
MFSAALSAAVAAPAVKQSTWLQVRHLIPIGVVGPATPPGPASTRPTCPTRRPT